MTALDDPARATVSGRLVLLDEVRRRARHRRGRPHRGHRGRPGRWGRRNPCAPWGCGGRPPHRPRLRRCPRPRLGRARRHGRPGGAGRHGTSPRGARGHVVPADLRDGALRAAHGVRRLRARVAPGRAAERRGAPRLQHGGALPGALAPGRPSGRPAAPSRRPRRGSPGHLHGRPADHDHRARAAWCDRAHRPACRPRRARLPGALGGQRGRGTPRLRRRGGLHDASLQRHGRRRPP